MYSDNKPTPDVKEVTLEMARGIAARIWCDPDYSHVLMNERLANDIALALKEWADKNAPGPQCSGAEYES